MAIIGLLWISGIMISIAVIIIMIKTIVNIINNDKINNNSKLFWIVLIIATHLLGLIIYVLVDNKNVLTE